MRRTIAFFCAAALLCCLCACAAAPQTPDDVSEPAVSEQPAADAAVSDTGTPVFRLSSLPDIGKYRPNSPEYFYEGPLNAFTPSDDYGTIVPYLLHGNETVGDVEILHCGFMTADGKIITGPIYDDIRCIGYEDKSVYLAVRKLLVPTPTRLEPYSADMTEEEMNARAEAYREAEETIAKNRSVDMIATDGSKYITLTGCDPELIWPIRYEDSFVFFDCPGVRHTTGRSHFAVYDADLNQIADLSGLSSLLADETEYISFIGADKTGFALETSYWDDEPHNIVILTEGETVTKRLEMSSHVDAVYGDMLVSTGAGKIFDMNGNVRYAVSPNGSVLCDPDIDCLCFADPELGRLTQIDRSGRETVRACPQANGYSLLSLKDTDGVAYIVLCAETNYQTDRITVFDSGLREIYRTPDSADGQVSCVSDYEHSTGLIAIEKNGGAELRSLKGELLGETPAAVTGGRSDRRDAYLLFGEGDNAYLYPAADGSVQTLPAGDYYLYADRNVCVVEKMIEYPNYHRTIYNSTDLSVLGDDIRGFLATTVNGKTYYAYVNGSTACVRDEAGGVLLQAYDGTFV